MAVALAALAQPTADAGKPKVGVDLNGASGHYSQTGSPGGGGAPAPPPDVCAGLDLSVCDNETQNLIHSADPTTGQVASAFVRLRWPSAHLTLQPPDHRTLVNLPTVFSTDLTAPQTRTVTLLGARVTVQATPVGYRWHPGDGTSWATDDAGTSYAAGDDVTALNTHTFVAAGRVSASVDVTYHGRYRVGGGAWTDIGRELTVAGTSVALRVLEAHGSLTG